MVVYSGKPAEDVPSVSINEEGYWCYLLNGNEVVLTDDASNNLYALPTNGKDGITPKISVNADGYWVYSLDGGQTWKLFESEGVTAVANPEKLPSSLFTDVAVNQENQTVTFTLAAGGDPVTVPLYTDMVFTLIDNTLSIDKILTFEKDETKYFINCYEKDKTNYINIAVCIVHFHNECTDYGTVCAFSYQFFFVTV